MQSAGISGFPYFNHDAGGHLNVTVNEDNLYRQWDMGFGSFTPIWKPHGPSHKRWPLQRNTTCQATAKTFITTRYQMIPYIYSYAHIAQADRHPHGAADVPRGPGQCDRMAEGPAVHVGAGDAGRAQLLGRRQQRLGVAAEGQLVLLLGRQEVRRRQDGKHLRGDGRGAGLRARKARSFPWRRSPSPPSSSPRTICWSTPTRAPTGPSSSTRTTA